MHNLIIVGNGFDLAHGLKTSYTDFVKHIIDTRSEDPDSYHNLLKTPTRIKFPNYDRLKASPRNEYGGFFSNLFFRKIFEEMSVNWCDVEKLYFQQLISNTNSYVLESGKSSPIHLNKQFGVVKEELEKYLLKEQKEFKPISVYQDFFKEIDLSSSNNLILNFNYTQTVLQYILPNTQLKQIHIHGELNSKKNPIIFGFAANDIESRELISKDDNEFMRNIKKHNYKRTHNETKLIDYLNDKEKIDVLILGHSCGLSDKLILNQIFNHDNVSTICVFYFEYYENYFNTQVNIDRIMNNDSNFKKLVNYSHCHRMPQFSDSEEQYERFKIHIQRHLRRQKRAREDEGYSNAVILR